MFKLFLDRFKSSLGISAQTLECFRRIRTALCLFAFSQHFRPVSNLELLLLGLRKIEVILYSLDLLLSSKSLDRLSVTHLQLSQANLTN